MRIRAAPPSDAGAWSEYRVLSRAHDEVRRYSRAERAARRAPFAALCRTARVVARRLIDPLADLLLEQRHSALVAGFAAGPRLDPRALPRLACGLPVGDGWMDVERAESAAVLLLIDLSGSMRVRDRPDGPSRAEMARACAACVHLALEPSVVPLAVVGFTSREEPVPGLRALVAERVAAGDDLRGYVRTHQAAQHVVFCDFGEEPTPLVDIAPQRENFDGEAVEFGHSLLRQRAEVRRVMVVLSDGFPAGGHHQPTERMHLRRAVRKAVDEGIDVVGVGVLSSAVHGFYLEAVTVDSLERLPEALLGVLRRALTR